METLVRTSMHAPQSDSGETRYFWRRRDKRSGWQEPLQQGSGAQLAAALHGNDNALVLVLPGSMVVTHSLAAKDAERKHLADLAPFAVEDDIVSPIDAVHVAPGKCADDSVALACVDHALLQATITALEVLGLEVSHCIPEPLLLPRPAQGWCLHWLDGEVQVHYGAGLGFALETALAGTALAALAASVEEPENIVLLANTQSGLNALGALLPAQIANRVGTRELAQTWDRFIPTRASLMDLRQGNFARQLPLRRWWREVRSVALLGAAALIVYVASTLAQIQIDKAQTRRLQQEITATYRELMPEGELVDAAQQLRNQIAVLDDAGGAVPLLAAVAPFLAAGGAVELYRLSYKAQNHELQLAVGAQTNADILALGAALGRRGLRAETQQMLRQGERQQAHLVITENAR